VYGDAIVGLRLPQSFLQYFIVECVEVTGDAEDLPIFDAEGPVPGCFDDAGSFWIFEQDSGVIVHFRIDIGLYMMGHGGHGGGGPTVHEPGHEVCAIAAEVADCAAAIFYWIGQPAQKVGAAADLLRTLVAVVHDHLSGFADEVLLVYHFKDLLVCVVPCRLVVSEDVDVVLFCEGCDAVGVFHGGGERFFYHDGDPFWRAGFDDADVFGDGVVGEDGVWVGMVDEIGQVIIEERVGQLVGFLVARDQLRIGFGDAGDDHLSRPELVHDIVHVIMRQAGDSNPQNFLPRGGGGCQ
jgi:hypothetical protein